MQPSHSVAKQKLPFESASRTSALDTNWQEGYFSLAIIAKTKVISKALNGRIERDYGSLAPLRRSVPLDRRHLWAVFVQGNVREGYSKLPVESAK
jgi:hypothetical protein